MADSKSYLTATPHGIRLTIKAKPEVRHARKAKIVDVGDGQCAVEIAMSAAPEDGKANKAIIEMIAKNLDVPKAAVSIKTGTTGRLKIVEIEGEPSLLATKLQAWLGLSEP